MCFSAQASFITGTILTLFGINLLKSVRQKKFLYFKAIPLMFGIQQLCEGFVWVTQLNSELSLYNAIFRYAFLFFAFIVWPLFVPFALFQIENNPARKRC